MMTGIAVVGAGHWGPHLIRNFSDHPQSEVLWVIDRSPERLKQVGQRFRSVSLSGQLDDALNDDRVDAVIVATPTATHHDVVLTALDAGKHVLVEKPIATSVAHARAMVELAEGRRLTLMVGHVFLFNPAILAAKEIIRSGEAGAVYYLSMTRTNLGPVRTDVNAAWDLASHDISIANDWLDSVPVKVSATGGSWLNKGVEDAVFATLRYQSGVVVQVHASWLNPRKSRMITVVGSKKMLTVDDMDLNEPLRLYDKGVEEAGDFTDTFAAFRASIREGTITIPRIGVGEPLRAECESFLTRLRGDTQSTSDGRAGLGVVCVLEAIDASLATGGGEIEVAQP